jgi:hypothetical protein
MFYHYDLCDLEILGPRWDIWPPADIRHSCRPGQAHVLHLLHITVVLLMLPTSLHSNALACWFTIMEY